MKTKNDLVKRKTQMNCKYIIKNAKKITKNFLVSVY